MPVAAHIDPESRFVMFRCSGHVAMAEARRAFDQMMTDPAVQPAACALWDLRSALIAERTAAIPDILDMMQNRHPERASAHRVAILVAEEFDAGISTLVERSVSTPPFNVRVFSNYVNAARWLAGDDA